VIGTGLGLPGPVHRGTGRVGSTAILPAWGGLRVAEEMEQRLRLPVHVDNDANLGALAELFWGAGHGAGSLVYLKIATGIGAGLVIDRQLYYGAGGTAGEIGHLTIDEDGPLCRCGSRGCLETFAAAPAIVELLRSSLGHDLTIEEVVERAVAGDPGCWRAIADAGRHVGHAVATMCNLFNPERVVVGGSVGQARELLLAEMRDAVRRWAIASAAQDVEIVAGVLGERAEMLGALALVMHESERFAGADLLSEAA
jgi:predicted NBD/HSP70 family sugar kinase